MKDRGMIGLHTERSLTSRENEPVSVALTHVHLQRCRRVGGPPSQGPQHVEPVPETTEIAEPQQSLRRQSLERIVRVRGEIMGLIIIRTD